MIIRNTKTIKTKKGELMAFVTIEDIHGTVEVTIFSSVYAKACDLLADDNPLIIEGHVQKDEKSVKILANTVMPIDKAEETWTISIHLNLDINGAEKDLFVKLYDIFKKHPGSCQAYVHLRDPEKTETVLALPDNIKLKAGLSLTSEVNGFLGYNAVETVCIPINSSLRSNNNFNGNFKKG